jgi:hypothetical protein
VATPAPAGATVTARLNFRLQPLGAVSYDGQVLPLVSPDGKFMAVEQGDAPTWADMLAAPEATGSRGTSLTVYDLSQSPMREVSLREHPDRGAILGRSCDTRGFLVEWPRPDGSRWIGRVPWLGGPTEWLAQGAEVSAHAVLADDGAIAYTRRAVGGDDRSELVVRDAQGGVRTWSLPGASCAFPLFTDSGRVVCTLLLSPAGLEIAAIRVGHADGTRAMTLGAPLSRRVLASTGNMTTAYQAVAGASAAPIAGAHGAPPGEEPLLLFHPGLARIAAFWWRDGTILPLAEGSIAGVYSNLVEPPGCFLTTPDGLVFAPLPGSGPDPNPRPVARLMEVVYVPRGTRDADRPLVLIGPASKRDPTRLTVVGFTPLPPEQPPGA